MNLVLSYINYLSIEVVLNLDVRFSVELQPGLWVVTEAGRQYSVTRLVGCLEPDSNTIRLMYPKGVCRRPSGAWGAQEHVLADFRDWHLVPDEVRGAIDDAFTLRRQALPDSLGALP